MISVRSISVVAAGFGLLGFGTGCISCKHDAFLNSIKAYDLTAVPAPQRQRVHLFIMNGADGIGLCSLRDRLCEAGFPKVHIAHRMDANWYEREVRRVALEDPSARVILLGTGMANDKLLRLAEGAVSDGVNVDAIFLLDPIISNEIPGGPYRTIVIRSQGWPLGRKAVGDENIVVRGTGHLALACCPGTVEAVVQQMVVSAERVGSVPCDPLPRVALSDVPNPTPRGVNLANIYGNAEAESILLAPPTLDRLTIPSVTGTETILNQPRVEH